jgi:hypothetical protein
MISGPNTNGNVLANASANREVSRRKFNLDGICCFIFEHTEHKKKRKKKEKKRGQKSEDAHEKKPLNIK